MSRRSATAAVLLVSWLVAGLALTAPVGASTATIVIKDTFKSASLSGSDGTHPWASNWKELGENNGPSAGYVWVYGSAPCWSSYCLKMGGSGIEPNGIGAQRAADLSKGIGGKLCFDFRRELLGEPGGRFKVKISADGGKS